MNEFEKRVLNVIEQYGLILSGDRIVVGFSGGPDSTALMQCLYNINCKSNLHFEIIAVHINHGIRENAKLDEEFVKDFCQDHNINLKIVHSKVPNLAKELKRGLEEVGRMVRYSSYIDVANENKTKIIAVAHNQKDKVETIMMNVMRGCGLSGLRGIEEIQDQNGYLYIRPLLQESRESIEQYLKDQKIKARIDESNFDNTYTRNKIRNVVLPYIEKEFNPNIITSVDRMSNIIKEEDEFLDNITQSVFLETCISYNLVAEEGFENVLDKLEKDRKGKRFNQIILDLRKFNAQHPVIQKRLVLKAIQRLFGTTQGIEQVHVQDIVKLCNNNIGNKYLTPNKFTQIVIKNKKIYLNRLK